MPTITPEDAALGAVVTDVDLHGPLDDDVVAELRAALVRHQVLFFPRADITPAEHVRLGSYFGHVDRHKALTALPDQPEVVVLDTDATYDITKVGWHSDVACSPTPPLGAILQMKIVPPAGGATYWASMSAAYDALDAATKQRLAGLTAVNRSWWQPTEETSHPVVRTHPESGRKGIFADRIFTKRINELDEAESSELLEFLFAHATKDEWTVRHDWQAGDLAFWDNRQTQHRADADIGDHRRCGHRIQIRGEAPR